MSLSEIQAREDLLNALGSALSNPVRRWAVRQMLDHGTVALHEVQREFSYLPNAHISTQLRPLLRDGLCWQQAKGRQGQRGCNLSIYTLTEQGHAALADLRALIQPLEAQDDEPA